MNALLVGGTGFIGRHTAEEFLEQGYDVTTLARGDPPDSLGAHESLSHRRGDRNDRATLEALRDETDPDVVVDLCGFHPRQVETATDVFADVDAYVYVSSAAAYDVDRMRVPMREGDPLLEWSEELAGEDSMEAYGAGKAACDRVCFGAAEEGTNAVVARPVCVYGPYDHTERHDYWFHRVNAYDRVVVPGDGDSTFHRVYVEDLARALRILAERGEPGEAYNVAERRTAWLDLTIALAAEFLDAEVETVHASARELAAGDLSPMDFPLYFPVPAVAASEKLAALGWDSTPMAETFPPTVEEHLESDRIGDSPEMVEFGVPREAEEAVLDSLST